MGVESRPRPFPIPLLSSHLQVPIDVVPVDVNSGIVLGILGRLSDDSPGERERSRMLLKELDPALLLVSLSSDGRSNSRPREGEFVGISFSYPRFSVEGAARRGVVVGDVERDEVVGELEGGREEMEVGEESYFSRTMAVSKQRSGSREGVG